MKKEIERLMGKVTPFVIFLILLPFSLLYTSCRALVRIIRRGVRG